jgi:macrolide transport system ATP-binding/permease protein
MTPLIDLVDIRKSYGGEGEARVEVLHGISLTIHAGEFVALIGASGSGKSTLMHILGCLDKPTSGTYRFAGRDISAFSADELAWLRREAFGFVFQGYHLIRALDASHNVQVPAVYAGTPPAVRVERAAELLGRLGLAERAGHRPGQLSGGQQQRVSIARALMNGGHVILADEPTGALDSQSGAEVMALLKDLAKAGHTVILITHDAKVAAQAHRVIQISDGAIQASGDREQESEKMTGGAAAANIPLIPDFRSLTPDAENASWLADAQEAVASAWRTLFNNRFRTLLTLLGIMIGVASVIVLVAVGQGTNESTMREMDTIGHAKRMAIRAGSGDLRSIQGLLTEADVQVAKTVPNIHIAMPAHSGEVFLRVGNIERRSSMWATTHEALELFHGTIEQGVFFNAQDEERLATVVVLGNTVRKQLFGGTDARGTLGQYVLINRVPFQVIGVLAPWGDDNYDESIFIPFSTGSHRILGKTDTDIIQLTVHDIEHTEATEAKLVAALEAARGTRDFAIGNAVAMLKAQREVAEQQSLLLALIAGISLVVGGIGVMNIMLMAVKERTREIGIRMAVGARQRDIQRQFLTEAVMLSLVGGLIGVVIGLSIGAALIFWEVPVIFSVRAMLLAFGCAVVTGLIFGYMPARAAARLDPVVALGGE